MKIKLETLDILHREGRWDIDYHLPPEGIKTFDPEILKPISEAADIVKDKRDPTKDPEKQFFYVDISCVDVVTGIIVKPQDLVGSEAPSRARKVINAYDLIISTCRPTRGAIAVIPEEYHDQICSTGFSVIRPKKGINPFYLHFAIRLASTLEQFRKFSTGSSYPAILDSDVEKTLIPLPDKNTQDLVASHILDELRARRKAIEKAD
ncbi:MAG: restriction endonuclease subunit S, partial [Nanoarchaeota archaeon]|nr:restriction endonuclease subunit S [Nanoarchaeota archaeon]